jgi:hypothetical protein
MTGHRTASLIEIMKGAIVVAALAVIVVLCGRETRLAKSLPDGGTEAVRFMNHPMGYSPGVTGISRCASGGSSARSISFPLIDAT